MSTSFSFNDDALRRFMETEAQAALNDMAQQKTQELNLLREQFRGRPVAEIKPALQQLYARDGGRITEPELSEWAQMISDGVQITFTAEKIRW